MKITHIITALNMGGAEMMLYKLLSKMDRSKFDVTVISLIDIGVIGQQMLAQGIPVLSLGMKRGIPNPKFIYKLAKMLKNENPDIVQTWMYHANLLGFFGAKLARIKKIIWSIRHGDINLSTSKKSTVAVSYMSGLVSNRVNKIVSCSEVSALSHQKQGYSKQKSVVIPNGFDIVQFSPEEKIKHSYRCMLNLPENSIVVGMIGRWHPDKDHRNFIKALDLLIQRVPNVVALLCGEGIVVENQQLHALVIEAKIEDHVRLLGRRDDMPNVMNSLDILVSSSIIEGFPNVLGEAMACEVPCVVTDVGDSAYIVGDTGIVVPPQNAVELSNAIVQLISLPPEKRKELGRMARQRVETNFEIGKIIRSYENLYLGLYHS